MPENEVSDVSGISSRQSGVLLLAIMIVALCGIVYELIIGAVSSYLLGNSVFQFSLTIGCFMFAMGLGSLVSKYFDEHYVRNFILIEIAIALIGGVCSIVLFTAFPFARALYEFVMYSLILMIGALVGMEIPILTTILSAKDSMRESIANVLSLDYLGALIGSVAFPLVLLPSLGLVRSSFAIGLINILVALLTVLVFKDHLKNYKKMLAACLSVLMLLVLCLAYGSYLTRFAEKHLYFDQVIYSEQTPYQKLVITRSATTREQRLYIDGHIQFSSRDEYRYHEYLIHPVMSAPGARANVLVLGGGDGLAVREILKYQDVERIDLVDIDPEMTRVASTLPMLRMLNRESLDSSKLTVFNEDAFSFINQPGIAYDRVIIDMPDPHNEALNKLYSREFYTMIGRRMAPDAMLVTQSSSPFFTRNTFWCIEETLASVFPQTLSYHTSLPSFGIWGFNLATNSQRLSDQLAIDVDTRAITSETFRASTSFDKDLAKIEVPVNSIMEPKLYHLYLKDLQY